MFVIHLDYGNSKKIMRNIYSDINIVGGGLIGAAAALSLSKFDLKITILEKKPTFNSKKHADQRTVAISEGTKNFLDKIGIWTEAKKFAEPIKKILVIDRKITNKLEFNNERRSSNLGYIINNRDLLQVLYDKIKKQKNIKVLNNIKIIDTQNTENLIKTFTNTHSINSNLNIAADGKNSTIKNIFKTPFYSKKYDKKAFVITFSHVKNHNGTAYEFFYKNGPLAILPMKKNNNHFTSSIVWTNKSKYIDSLLNMDESKIISILNDQTKLVVGNINNIITKQVFPLTAHLNSKFYEDRTIYIGDSAHSFHPIAGQGWNLGMNDVENLFNLVLKYKSLGIELGNNLFCKQYHNDSFYKAYRLYQVTDKLDSIFQIQNPVFNFMRSSCINYIQKNRFIKNIISDFAMGIN